jgi:hypothetical protein
MHARSRLLTLVRAIALLALLPLAADAHAQSAAGDRRQLQIQQQQDALNLQLQQSIRARRYDLPPADERRLDQLQLQQRIEQQMLEQQQLQRENQLGRPPGAPPLAAEHSRDALQSERFAQERQLQIQRFDMEQQQLLNSSRASQLQPPPPGGRLNLP